MSTSPEVESGNVPALLNPSRLVPLVATDEVRRTVMLCCSASIIRRSRAYYFPLAWFFDVTVPINNIQGYTLFFRTATTNTWRIFWRLVRVGTNGNAGGRIYIGTFQTGPTIAFTNTITLGPAPSTNSGSQTVVIPNTSPRDVWYNNIDAALTTNGGTLPLW